VWGVEGGLRVGVTEVIIENGDVGRSGAALGYFVIVGVSKPEMDGPLGEVNLEQTLNRGRRCPATVKPVGSGVPADWACVESCDDGSCGDVRCTIPVQRPTGALSHRAWPVPFSADDRELGRISVCS
jgi:hypothetical protein